MGKDNSRDKDKDKAGISPRRDRLRTSRVSRILMPEDNRSEDSPKAPRILRMEDNHKREPLPNRANSRADLMPEDNKSEDSPKAARILRMEGSHTM